MGKLTPLVEKEVKDLLRDPRIYVGLIIPIIMLPIIGFTMSTAMRSATEVAAKGLNIALIDYDNTDTSCNFVSILVRLGLNVTNVSPYGLDKALKELRNLRSRALLVIPIGFEKNLLSNKRAEVDVYSVIESIGISSAGVYSAIDAVLEASSEMLSNILIANQIPIIDPVAIREPLNITRYAIVKDVVMYTNPQALLGQLLTGYSVMIPMVLFILTLMVTQTAAIATAVENEEKTLETLLTFPVTRYDILIAKLLGSSVVAVLGSAIFVLGFSLYFQGILNFMGPNFEVGSIFQALPLPSVEAYVVLLLSLVLSILFMTSLGVVIGALSNDVRMSNSLLGVIIIPVLIPSFTIMYGDLSTVPMALKIFTYSLPTSYPMIVAKEMITSAIPVEAIYGIPYSAALTLIVLYATSKLFAPEKLLTLQHKLRLRRVKREQAEDFE